MASIGFPLSLVRMGAEPLDVSEVFKTTQERIDYLTNGTRYAGMIVYDYEADKHYRLSKDTNNWQELQSGSESSTTIDDWKSATEYNLGDYVVHQKPDLYGDDGTGTQVLLKTYYPCLYRCKTAHVSSTDFDTDVINWETIDGTEFNEISISELEQMVGLSENQIQTLQSIILDTVSPDHCWSSSMTYMKLLDTLAQAKAYTDSTIASSTKIEKEVVTVLPDVANANPNTMYLIKDASSTTNDVYLQYMLIGGAFVSLGKTGGEFPIKIYDTTKAYAKDDLVLAKIGGSLTYNIFRCVNASGVLANTGWTDSDWEVTNGSKLKVEANANNTPSDYRLDITQPDGEIFTTENLHGIDSAQVPLNGFYRIVVENGNLFLLTEDGATPPPISIENGCLIYTVGGTIQYESVEYGV